MSLDVEYLPFGFECDKGRCYRDPLAPWRSREMPDIDPQMTRIDTLVPADDPGCLLAKFGQPRRGKDMYTRIAKRMGRIGIPDDRS